MSNMDREKLEAMDHGELPANTKHYVPRPKWQLALAWVGIAVVVFAFLGTIYWMINYGA